MRRRLRLDRGTIRTGLIVAGCLVGRPTAITLIVGWVLLIPGALLHFWAKGCLHQNVEVTCAGPYRWTRNPFYLANLIIDLAVCVVINQPLVYLVYLPVWFWVYRRAILGEERHLESLFGDRYRHYRQRVPRFWPTRIPAKDLVETAPFSWRNPNLMWGSEYGRLLRAVAAPLLILVCGELRQHGAAVLTVHHSLVFVAIVLVLVLSGLERAAIRRFRLGRRLVPPVLQHWAAHAAVMAGFAAAMWSADFLETEWDSLLLPLGGAFFVLSFLALMLPGTSFLSPAMIRWGEGAACLVGGLLAGMPWLGLLGLGYFGVLAMDATRTVAFLQTDTASVAGDGRLLHLQRRLVLLALIVLSALAFLKEYREPGRHPGERAGASGPSGDRLAPGPSTCGASSASAASLTLRRIASTSASPAVGRTRRTVFGRHRVSNSRTSPYSRSPKQNRCGQAG